MSAYKAYRRDLDSANVDLTELFKVLTVFGTGVLVGVVVAAYYIFF